MRTFILYDSLIYVQRLSTSETPEEVEKSNEAFYKTDMALQFMVKILLYDY